MVLVFLDRFLVVYKPVIASGARSLNIFPCFVVDILEMKPERETVVNDNYQNADQYQNRILNSPIVVYFPKRNFS